jgi:hypothetical protein
LKATSGQIKDAGQVWQKIEQPLLKRANDHGHHRT